MITSFFKPKSQKKVQPLQVPSAMATSKRTLDTVEAEGPANKRIKKEGDDSRSEEVQALLSYLETHQEQDCTWKEVLQKHFKTPSFDRLAKFVSKQRYVPASSNSSLGLSDFVLMKILFAFIIYYVIIASPKQFFLRHKIPFQH